MSAADIPMANLVRRGQTYYARFFVPGDRQTDAARASGKPFGVLREITRTLQTTDRREAQRRLPAALAAIRAELDAKLQARRLPPLSDWRADWATRAADQRWRLTENSDRPYTTEPDPDTGEEHPTSVRDDVMEDIRDDYRALRTAQGTETAERFWKAATGGGASVRDAADDWFGRLERDRAVKAQTLGGHRATVDLFASYMLDRHGVSTLAALGLGDVSRALASGFLEWRAAMPSPKTGRPLAHATVKREVSSLNGLWRDARRRGLVETNPWDDQTAGLVKRPPSAADGDDDPRKRPYRVAELVALVRATGDAWAPNGGGYGPVLWDAVRLGLLTGCRANELAGLRVGDVVEDGKALCIRAGKTRNAARTVPLCPLAAAVVAQRLETLPSKDPGAPLWPELPPSGPDGRRGKLLSTRFGVARARILRGADNGRDPTGVDLHSLRRSFSAALRDAMNQGTRSITPNVIGALMGHAGTNLALNLYAPGALERDKRRAIDAMFRHGLDPAVRAALEETRHERPVVVRTAPATTAAKRPPARPGRPPNKPMARAGG